MAWFIGQSTIVIVLAFGLGLIVGWLLWARRMRLLTVEVVAARIRAAEHATGRSPYGRRITWTSSGRIAVDAHTPIGDQIASRRSPVDPDADGSEQLLAATGDRHGDSDKVNAVNVGNAGPPRAADGARHGLHIPAPRIEPADVADRDDRVFNGFDDDDGDDDLDAFDRAVDDFGAPFDSPFDPRFDDLPSPSDLRGLDRFRDLFTPSNGHAPRTPEPRRTEPDLAPAHDRDVDPTGDRRTNRDCADDTTLAAAGLADDVRHGAAVVDAGRTSEVVESDEASADGGPRDAALPDHGPADAALSDAVAAADDLSRIDGIGPKAATALVAAGIRTFDDLAAADGDKVAMALRASGVRLTSSVHAWPLAAHRLAVRRIVDRAGDSAPGAGGAGDPSPDLRRGGLLPKRRSPSTPARRSIPPDALDPDDFARIEGIGPAFAAALVASGIRTFRALAAADANRLRAAIEGAGLRPTSRLATWPAQARLLADDEEGPAGLARRMVGGHDDGPM